MNSDIVAMPAQSTYRPVFRYLIVVLWSMLATTALAQPPVTAEDLRNYESMIADPSSVDADEMASIYLSYIQSHLHRNTDTAFALYREMVEFGEKVDNEDVIAHGYASIAFMHKLMGDIDEQIRYGLKVLEFKHDSILLALTMSDIGSAHLQKTNFDSAHYYIDSAFVLGTQLDSSWRSTFYFHKCQLLIREKKHYAALDYLLNSIPFIPESNSMRRAEVFARVAQIYRTLGDLDKAIQYEEKCIEVSEVSNLQRELAFANTRLGKLHYLNKNDSLAYLYLSRALPSATDRNYNKTLLTAHSLLALLDLSTSNVASARRHIAIADSVFNLIPYKDNREDYYAAKIRLLMREGRIDEANMWSDRFLSYAKERNSPQTKLKAYVEIRSIQNALANWRSANQIADTILQLRTELASADQKQLVYDLETKYQSDLKNAEIQRLQNERLIDRLEMEKGRRQVWGLIGGLALALLAVLGTWYAYRIKKQSNQELRKLNHDLNKALEQNTLLIKEIHHRVKNNLQVVSSLLNLQGKFEKDESVLRAINTSKDRVQSISLLHKTLYDNQDLTSIQVRPYFNELLEHLVNSYLGKDNNLDLQTRIGNFQLDIDTLVPLGLIANELITNAFKYALPASANPQLEFSLVREGSSVLLSVRDNGPGLPVSSIPRRSRSLGMQLIHSFAERLDGNIEIDNSNGCRISLRFDQPTEAHGLTA